MNKIKKLFPIFNQGQKLAYLDSAASSQKPTVVLNRITEFFTKEYANIHRGAYSLSAEATRRYEEARIKAARFINAESESSIIFTRNATEGVNLVAHCLSEQLSEGDAILITKLEHHSNIVPWQLIAERKQLKVLFADINSDASLNAEDFYHKLKTYQPKIVATTMQSNAFGTITPYQKMIQAAHKQGAMVLLDAAQYIVHHPVDIQKIQPDFLVFTGHKIYGPTGIGVLYGKKTHLDSMPPYQGGGDMIQSVGTEGSVWAEVPQKFEAGTPAIGEAIALGTAIDFITDIGYEVIQAQDQKLTQNAIEILSSFPEVSVYGAKNNAIISFNINNIHPHDFASIADSEGVQIRAGFHCAMPALKALNLSATARISFGIYNDIQDLEQLEVAVKKAVRVFGLDFGG